MDIDYEKEIVNKNIDKYNKEYINLLDNIKDIFSINIFLIEGTKFNKKFELKNCIINNFNFEDSNVKGIFDLYKSSFVKARFYKSIFEEFAAFEQVVFGNGKSGNKTEFIYTTFKDFSNFRDTKFKSGLSFSKANFKQEPNFLNTKINTEDTDRETFRIIKQSFDDVGNKLEANKFFAEEMIAYSKELLRKNGNYSEKFVFFTNYLVSNFGKSYVKPLVLLIILLFLYIGLYEFYRVWYQSGIYHLPEPLSNISNGLNNSAKSFLPFSRFIQERKDFEFISLIFYVLFAVLTWQIIVAVKRHTQR